METDALSRYANAASVDRLEGFRTHGQWIHGFTLRGINPLRINPCSGIGIDGFDEDESALFTGRAEL